MVWFTLGWQAIQFSGLFRWLAEWQIEHWGQYRTNLTLLIVGFTLSGPALHWLGVNERSRQKQEALLGDPAAKTVRARTFSLWMTAIASGIALFAFLRLQDFPSPKATPAEINLATLGTTEPPLGNAILIGTVNTQWSITTKHTTRYHQRQTTYFSIQAKDVSNAPIRFLVDRSIQTYSPQTSTPLHFFPTDRLPGTLLRNGLPALHAQNLRKPTSSSLILITF